MARGLDAGKYFWRSGREKCFSLDIPFNRTSGQRRLESVLERNFRVLSGHVVTAVPLLFQARPLAGKIVRESLHDRSYQLVCSSSTVRRGSCTNPVCSLLLCDRKSPISDSENKGMGSETAAALSNVCGSWTVTSLGPSGCFGGLP